MKKSFFYFLFLIISAVASFSCKKEEPKEIFEGPSIHFILNADTNSTKTYIVEGKDDDNNTCYLPKWGASDKIKVFFNGYDDNARNATFSNTATENDIASFEGDITGISEEGMVYCFYPASAYNSVMSNGIGINLPATQNPTATSFDPDADILIARPAEYLYESNDEGNCTAMSDLFFTRIMGVLKINLKSNYENVIGQTITSIKLTASDATLSGRVCVNLENASMGNWTVTNKEVSANYKNGEVAIAGSNNSVFLIVNPSKLLTGSTLSFEISSDEYNIHKDINLTQDINIVPGNITSINLNILEENCKIIEEETRILVESFDNVTTNKTQTPPSETGVIGTGVSENLTYVYSTANTNIRINTNGQSSTNPYLYISGVNEYLEIDNISISDETYVKFSCKTKTSGGTPNISLKYKSSDSIQWITADTQIGSDTKSWKDGFITFAVASSVTSVDIQIIGSNVLMIDDIVIEKYVEERTKLATPQNVTAALSDDSTNSLDISWGAVPNADSYDVILSADGDADITKNATTNSITVTDLEYSKTYSIKVKAKTSDTTSYIDSEYSSVVTATTGAAPVTSVEWIKKDLSQITATDVVVIAGPINGKSDPIYAISNNNGTSKAPDAVTISVSENKITSSVPNTLKWNIAGNSSDGYVIYPAGQTSMWLYCNTTASSKSNDNIRVGTGNRKSWIFNSYNEFETKDSYTKRYLCIYASNPDWRGYTNYSTAGIISFYVKVGGTDEGDDTTPTELEMSDVSCSAHSQTSLTFSWDAVDHATSYQIYFDSVDKGTVTETSYTATNLLAGTSHTIAVKAVGDDVNYTTSTTAKTCTVSTDSEESGGDDDGGGDGDSDSYTIVFKIGTGDGSDVNTSTKCSDIVTSGAEFLDGNVATATKVYYNGSNGLKLGASSSAGTIKMSLSTSGQVNPKSIIVKAKQYNSSKPVTLKVNGSATQDLTADFAEYTYSITSKITYLELVSSKYCWIQEITVNY